MHEHPVGSQISVYAGTQMIKIQAAPTGFKETAASVLRVIAPRCATQANSPH